MNQALIDLTFRPVNLNTCPTVQLDSHSDCLLRIIWTPVAPHLRSAVGDGVGYVSNLHHVLYFGLSRGAMVEAVIVASSVNQPDKVKKRAWNKRSRGILVSLFILKIDICVLGGLHSKLLMNSIVILGSNKCRPDCCFKC